MAEEEKQKIEEKKETTEKIAEAEEEKKQIEKEKISENVKEGAKKEEKKGKQKKEGKRPADKIIRRYEAVVRGHELPISTKYSVGICKFIINKRIEEAIDNLNQVIKKKKVVPMKGEIAHRKGKGISSGKYPIKSTEYFIKMLKTLRGNAINNGMELENTKITEAIANKASRPYRRFGTRQFKRTHIQIRCKEKKEKEKKKN